jgi:hypothetical protein
VHLALELPGISTERFGVWQASTSRSTRASKSRISWRLCLSDVTQSLRSHPRIFSSLPGPLSGSNSRRPAWQGTRQPIECNLRFARLLRRPLARNSSYFLLDNRKKVSYTVRLGHYSGMRISRACRLVRRGRDCDYFWQVSQFSDTFGSRNSEPTRRSLSVVPPGTQGLSGDRGSRFKIGASDIHFSMNKAVKLLKTRASVK